MRVHAVFLFCICLLVLWSVCLRVHVYTCTRMPNSSFWVWDTLHKPLLEVKDIREYVSWRLCLLRHLCSSAGEQSHASNTYSFVVLQHRVSLYNRRAIKTLFIKQNLSMHKFMLFDHGGQRKLLYSKTVWFNLTKKCWTQIYCENYYAPLCDHLSVRPLIYLFIHLKHPNQRY